MYRLLLLSLFGSLLSAAICCGAAEAGVITFSGEVGRADCPGVSEPCLGGQTEPVAEEGPRLLKSDGGMGASRPRSCGGPDWVASNPTMRRSLEPSSRWRLSCFEALRMPDGFAMCLLKIPIANVQAIIVSM